VCLTLNLSRWAKVGFVCRIRLIPSTWYQQRSRVPMLWEGTELPARRSRNDNRAPSSVSDVLDLFPLSSCIGPVCWNTFSVTVVQLCPTADFVSLVRLEVPRNVWDIVKRAAGKGSEERSVFSLRQGKGKVHPRTGHEGPEGGVEA